MVIIFKGSSPLLEILFFQNILDKGVENSEKRHLILFVGDEVFNFDLLVYQIKDTAHVFVLQDDLVLRLLVVLDLRENSLSGLYCNP